MMKIQSSSVSLQGNARVRYKVKGKIVLGPNIQQAKRNNDNTGENNKIDRLTKLQNTLETRVSELKSEKKHFDQKIRRAIMILRLKQPSSASGEGGNSNSVAEGNDQDNTLQANLEKGFVAPDSLENNENQSTIDEKNNKEVNSGKVTDEAENTAEINNKSEKIEQENGEAEENNKILKENASKQEGKSGATQAVFTEEDMSDKDDKVEKSFLGKTLDELEDMLKEYDAKSQAEIDKLESSIRKLKVEVLKMKTNKQTNKDSEKEINKTSKNKLDLLI